MKSDNLDSRRVKPGENRVQYMVDEARRRLLKNIALGMALMPIAGAPLTAAAADAPLVAADDPTAKALKYVSDASKSVDAKRGSTCANCKLYQGAAGAAQGGCLLFPGKSVKSTGWCISWAAQT
jgi:hypothetical protein